MNFAQSFDPPIINTANNQLIMITERGITPTSNPLAFAKSA